MSKCMRCLLIGLAGFGLAIAAVRADKPQTITYPKTKTVDQVDEYHGIKVSDPYRWLEDLDSAETAEWVKAQNEVTFAYLKNIPARDRIAQRLTKLWDYEKFGMPGREGNRYFYSRNSGLQNQSVLYWTDDLSKDGQILIDPNTLSADGTVALGSSDISKDGNLFAYCLNAAGSDWADIHVREVATGKELPDVIKWVKFGGPAWTKDGKGFFYSAFDEPKAGENAMEAQNYYQKLYYHRLGEPQSKDTLVYHSPEHKDWGFGGGVTDDGKYLIISVSQGTERKNRLYYQDISTGVQPYKSDGSTAVKLFDDFDAQYSLVDNDGSVFWIHTDKDAPRGKLIAVDTTKPAKENWRELIPESEDTLQGIGVVNNTFVASYLHDAYTQVKMFDLTGKPVRDVKFPGIGTASGFGGKRDYTETFYSFTSYNIPPTIYRYDMKTGNSTVFRQPKVDIKPDNFEVKQVFYPSKDGTKIPMFLAYKKGMVLDGNNPTLLYGYGGFNIPLTPYFSVSNAVWMEMGGVYAVANLRGGGEYGKAWHDAGRLKNKQNVFDDFIAAGEWLIKNKYTQSAKLAIFGGSNGGLLVGACMTQRPDLFGAALPVVGVMDMMRFDKFTIGWAWQSDYGKSDDPAMMKIRHSYSPLHNLKKGTAYPATLITTGDHDDRVVPSHSFKFAAQLQAVQSGPAPCLIRIETRAGHGAGKPTDKVIEETADRWAFLVKNLGMTDVPPSLIGDAKKGEEKPTTN